MTRRFTRTPVWTWACDRCDVESGDLANHQAGLPSFKQMQERGWHIAATFGDLCPACAKEAKP